MSKSLGHAFTAFGLAALGAAAFISGQIHEKTQATATFNRVADNMQKKANITPDETVKNEYQTKADCYRNAAQLSASDDADLPGVARIEFMAGLIATGFGLLLSKTAVRNPPPLPHYKPS